MEHLNFSAPEGGFDEFAGSLGGDDLRSQTYPPFHPSNRQPTWSSLAYQAMENENPIYQHNQYHAQPYLAPGHEQRMHEEHYSRPTSNHGHPNARPYLPEFDLDYAPLMPNEWQFQLDHAAQQNLQRQYTHQQARYTPRNARPTHPNTYSTLGGHLQASPIEFMPSATTATGFPVSAGMDSAAFMSMAGPMESMNALVFPLDDYQNEMEFPMALDTAALHQHVLNQQAADGSVASAPGSSPGTLYEIQSVSDHEWSLINRNTNRNSIDSIGTVSNPSQNLHIRTSSESSCSDEPDSTGLSGSYEEITPWPLSSPHDFHGTDYLDAHYIQQQTHGLPIPYQQFQHPVTEHVDASSVAGPSYHPSASTGSASTSPTSSGPTSPPLRRRKSPVDGKSTKAALKKTLSGNRKDAAVEKKVGRRRGPLRPEQRQQAHEIRKLRACLRCKFLKKTCDKGEPCGGCRPSHARLWQVPCTRMDIKDISYFMKDYKADFERHVSLGFSIGNIKGFSANERVLYITHGYGHYIPINVREVFVRNDNCFDVDWREGLHDPPRDFEVNTAKLSVGAEGVSPALLSEYLDRHLDHNFEEFVDQYFQGTAFLTEMLKTAPRYYQKDKNTAIRKALKLVIAYNLTLSVTMVEGLSEEEHFLGKIDDEGSSYFGKTMAPVMINFQIKCALSDLWRDLQKEILEELSTLYSSVYSGDKLKNWPTIFMLAALLLAVWEEMQFDCCYRVPDEKKVNKFCDDMESTPVGVIVGLFQAISTKLPGLQEWDTRKHHHLLGSNAAVCEALTEVKGHVNHYGESLDRISDCRGLY